MNSIKSKGYIFLAFTFVIITIWTILHNFFVKVIYESNPSFEAVNIHQLIPQSKYADIKKNNPNFMKNILCELDKLRLAKIENFDFRKFTKDQIEDALHDFIMDPTETVCKSKYRFGGRYLTQCKYIDGGKYVCMDELFDDIVNNQCVIFSFGILNDWTFEDMMDNLGCSVYAFDPTVDFPSKRGKNITFEKLGVAAKTDEEKLMDTLSNILKKYGHENTKISYLKIDIEESELTGLPVWLLSGALKNIEQIAVEIHLKGTESTVEFFKTLRSLYLDGDYRLISYEPNACWRNLAHWEKFYSYSEIVLKKVSKEYKAAEKDC